MCNRPNPKSTVANIVNRAFQISPGFIMFDTDANAIRHVISINLLLSIKISSVFVMGIMTW